MVNKSPMFLDYKAHEEIKSQSRRDFEEKSGNKLLLQADGYLKEAIANFTLAGNNLDEAAGDLYRILEKFEKCRQILNQLPACEPLVAMAPATV